MKKISNKQIFFLTLTILVLSEIFSLLSLSYSWLSEIIFGILLSITLIVSLKNITYGFIILLTELVVGSQGYLFSFDESGNRLSLRIGLWIVVMVVWFFREKNNIFKAKNLKPYYFIFILLILAIIISYPVAYFYHNDFNLIFLEGKRWVYLLTILPALMILGNKIWRPKLLIILSAASVWLALKTLILLYVFSHETGFKDLIYTWTRYDYLGEITKLPNNFYRIFLQSQVFAVPAFFFALGFFLKELITNYWKINKKSLIYGLMSAGFLTTILISLSRSFWFGILVGFVVVLVLAWLMIKPKIKSLTLFAISNISIFFITFIFLFITISFPYPKALFSFKASLLTDRATSFEAAAASRWSLLPIMSQAIIENPIIGYGLGKTLTYKTSDPRITQSSATGEYTTNAFEWGWLDIWLKLGLFGFMVYLLFIASIIKQSWLIHKTSPHIAWPALASVLALVILNIFTPYLNHPLGFGYLAIIMILISHED